MRHFVGTAGWAVPRDVRDAFPEGGSGLERYAARFGCAEINSSFYRSHKRATWERWAASVPDSFRFSVRLPKAITHVAKLADCAAALGAFAEEVSLLGEKLGVVLVQLPPSLAFDAALADAFFASLRAALDRDVAVEPRHASWFADDADALLVRHRIVRVAADPPRAPGADVPGGWRGLAYFRLHGSPRVYYSAYDAAFIARIADAIARCDAPAWCIFDNTAGSAAAANALELKTALG